MNKTLSIDIYDRAQKVVPGGVQSGSRYREPHPWYFSSADGAWLTDIDGNRFLDLIMGNGAVMFGHGHPAVRDSVINTISNGITCGVETELSVIAAEKIASLLPGEPQIRFTNSGTEAALHCLRIARAYTEKLKIAKFEGSYHGWADPFMVSLWPDLSRAGPSHKPNPLPFTKGMLPDTYKNTIVLPFNNIQAVEEILKENSDQIAAVILEPVLIDIGFVPATKAFLKDLRRITEELDIVLIFDELLTGFRLAPGGAQEYFGIQADLCMLGKSVANGFPIAVVTGKKRYMDLIKPGGPVAFQGTFNGQVISLAAVNAVMDLLSDGKVIDALQEKTQAVQSGFDEICSKYGLEAILAGRGGHIHPYFVSSPPYDYRSAEKTNKKKYQAFSEQMIKSNIYFYQHPLLHHTISLAHGDDELEFLLEAMEKGLKAASDV